MKVSSSPPNSPQQRTLYAGPSGRDVGPLSAQSRYAAESRT
jgi:hypothetical protein